MPREAPAKGEGSGIQGERGLTQPDFTGQAKNETGETTQLVKYQPCKYENLNSIPGLMLKMSGMMAGAYNPSTGETEIG